MLDEFNGDHHDFGDPRITPAVRLGIYYYRSYHATSGHEGKELMVTYGYLKKFEAEEVYQLITEVFTEHVAPEYSAHGIERFFEKVSSSMIQDLCEGKESFVVAAKAEGKILGMIAVRNENHISLIFVNSQCQGSGIGKGLIKEATRICKQRNPGITSITVNSSPNSESFYEGIGFKPTDWELNDHGLRYKPMKMDLN